MEQVILVDEYDVSTGVMEKMEAHEKAILHRALSVFIFNAKGEMLLQQRSLHKYHSGGLWTNSCCSHPRPGEDTLIAATRRLQEEMGFTVPLSKVFDFVYHAKFENGLSEYEFDHVFVGKYDGEIAPDILEVNHYHYQPLSHIEIQLQNQPEMFTAWFHIAFPKVKKWYTENNLA